MRCLICMDVAPAVVAGYSLCTKHGTALVRWIMTDQGSADAWLRTQTEGYRQPW